MNQLSMMAPVAARLNLDANHAASPRLSALMSEDVASLLGPANALLMELVDGLGSPLHIVLPDAMLHCINQIEAVFKSANVRGQTHFALKANKADSFLHVAASAEIGADVASTEEFVAAIAAGICPNKLVVTGPQKSRALLTLALRHGAVITIDSVEELRTVQELTPNQSSHSKRLLIRHRPVSEKNSRFGMDDVEVFQAMERLRHDHTCKLLGFSVHLSGYSIEARALAGRALIQFCDCAAQMGMAASVINLGGGWPMSYCNPNDWQQFLGTETREFCHAEKQFLEFYPYASNLSAATAVEACLRHRLNGRLSLADELSTRDLTLFIEPGRSLLDQAGISLFRVQGVRQVSHNTGIITVEGQSFSLSEQWFGSEFCPDPILIQRCPKTGPAFSASIGGASCLDGDMLAWRRIQFPCRPEPDDIIAFVNTAGYQMDSNESPFHRRNLPRKVAVWSSDDRSNWCLDSEYKNCPATHGLEPLI